MGIYALKVYHRPRQRPHGVTRLKTHHINNESEHESRLELLRDYVDAGFKVLKIVRAKERSNNS